MTHSPSSLATRPETALLPAETAETAGAHANRQPAEALHVLLLLAHRTPAHAAHHLLKSRLDCVQVTFASSLSDAMIGCAVAPPALAVLDSALCDALDREFVDHLLQSTPDARVLMLGTDSQSWPRHPRLTHVSLAGLLPALERWLTMRPNAGAPPQELTV